MTHSPVTHPPVRPPLLIGPCRTYAPCAIGVVIGVDSVVVYGAPLT